MEMAKPNALNMKPWHVLLACYTVERKVETAWHAFFMNLIIRFYNFAGKVNFVLRLLLF